MAASVRIEGLVRIADGVRRELSAPISARRRDHLRAHVAESLARVQRILTTRGAAVHHLPAPSRRAHEFLATIDWDNIGANVSAPDRPLSAPTDHEDEASQTILGWRGLGSFIEKTLGRLSVDLSGGEFDSVAQAIVRTSRQIEGMIQRRRVSPDQLSASTRSRRGWLAFMAKRDNALSYIAARQTASRIIDSKASRSRHYPPPLAIHFGPMNGIYKLRARRSGAVLSLPTPMICFNNRGFDLLGQLIFSRNSAARQGVVELMTGAEFQGIQAEIESLGGVVEQSRGAIHDLKESFDRINTEYFAGGMPRPRLTWNRTFTGRKFGHYDFVHDTVMVSRTLDAGDVPAFVVDFLVFHEVLHKFHGLHWVNGRGYAHTSEFQQDERRFARYVEAEAILQKLAMESR